MKLIKIPVVKYQAPDPVTGEQQPFESYIYANPAMIAAVWLGDDGKTCFFVVGPDMWHTSLSEDQLLDVINKSSTYSLN